MDKTNLPEGRYYYGRHRSSWGVWRAGKTVNGTRMDDFISDFSTKVQAEKFVYRMNGWTKIKEEEE
jgi:hypothetical protein